MAYGETDETASKVITGAVTISDINATVAHLAGLDVKKEYLSPTGRPFELADKGKIITSILS